jgi:predicted transcriptional regulator
MIIMPAPNKYDLAESQMKAFTRSAVRTKTLLALQEEEKDSGNLEKELGIRASTILHSIKDMAEAGLVRKGNKGYTLTNIGRVQAILIDELVSAIVILDQHKNFWQTHDMGEIPYDLLAKIGMLGRSEILVGDHAAILKTQEYWYSEVVKSKIIVGVSPIIIPTHPIAITKALENGAKVELVLTKTILDIVIRDYEDLIKTLLTDKNFKLYRIDRDVKIAYTVTDSYLSLGLFRIDGGYDVGCDLNCYGDKARDWGMKLFEYHRNMSVPVNRV